MAANDLENQIFEQDMQNKAVANKAAAEAPEGTKQTGYTTYTVDPAQMKSWVDKEAALEELRTYQQSIVADYSTWAKEKVKYSDMTTENKAAAQQLKRCNDSYAMSMLMQCMAPLQQGIDKDSLLASFFTYKIAEMTNPSLKQDTSRLLANYGSTLRPMIASLSQKHPLIGSFLDSKLGKYMQEPASKLMNNEIRNAEQMNTVDDLVMTPRQLAALKLNFMEQYYVDMRQYNSDYAEDRNKLEQMEREYNTAMEHVATIAMNGGFDMSVVAAEERYLVGLKMLENPNYGNMFEETCDAYGAKPQVDPSGIWSGDFVTGDNHEYTTGGDSSNGAFTVRKPIRNSAPLEKKLTRQAEQFASMMCFLDSAKCPLDEKVVSQIKDNLNGTMSAFKDSTINMMCDDYCNSESKRGCGKIWDKAFTETYNDAVKGRKDIDFADAKQDAYKGNEFYAELCHVVDTQCLMDLGIIKDKSEDITAGRIKQKIEAAARNRDHSDTRSASEILADMRDDYMKQMTPQELTALMVHVGTNMEQGMRANHRYARHGMEDASEKLVEEYAGNFDASPTGAVVKGKNGQEASTPNSQKVDMNIDFGVDDDDDYSIDISDLQA